MFSRTYNFDRDSDICLVFLPRDQELHEGGFEGDCCSEVSTLFEDHQVDASSLGMDITNGLISHLLETEFSEDSSVGTYRVVRFKLDSRYFRRASPVFDELLDKYVGSPGYSSQRHDASLIPLWGDDPSVLALILDLIYKDKHPVAEPEGQERRASVFPPAGVQLSTLALIATTVEKYKLYPLVKGHLNEWIGKLWKGMAGSTIEEAIEWVWISWVFKLTTHFEESTTYAAKNVTKRLEDDELIWKFPIPREIIHAIDNSRTNALSEFYSLYETVLNQRAKEVMTWNQMNAGPQETSNVNNPDVATFDRIIFQKACGYGVLFLLGSKLRFWSEHKADFEGMSYTKAKQSISDVFKKVASTRPERRNPSYYLWTPNDTFCDIGWLSSFGSQFEDLIQCTEGREWGLRIDDIRASF